MIVYDTPATFGIATINPGTVEGGKLVAVSKIALANEFN